MSPIDAGEAAARVRQLSDRIVAGRTATGALFIWCNENGISTGAIRAVTLKRRPSHVVGRKIARALNVSLYDAVGYRRVQLLRGEVLLSQASNWFIPSSLPDEIRNTLEHEDLPFGTVVAPLNPFRRTFKVRTLLPIEDRPNSPTPVLEHEAVVYSEAGMPLAFVRERYFSTLVRYSAANTPKAR
ncbi:hypothetical protein [Azospirillum sp. SYSU D00513]|uniref:hypothetical protein n=1 Tax=Azospirillum sp. SYSU D00513 TaxID=2812561 RepID=UPI001A95D286|nr:hypothetical protein [Azospirillum sp. SYSU D00513]